MPGPRLSTTEQPVLRPERFLELIAPKLELVEQELRKNFASPITTIEEVGHHILAGGGKRLRPALLLLSARMLGYDGPADVVYASVVEFIHTATLVHDDIIDEAALRRGRTSINYRWGNHLTVLVGDYLYTHAMKMALDEGRIEVLRLLSSITIGMIEGEILGLERTNRSDLTESDYFDVVGRKTAALFGGSCRIPGYLVDLDDASARALYDYGYSLGVAFQLIDDLLDFTSSEEILGKPALADLKEGKLTLPLILALRRANERERRLIERVMVQKSFEEIDPEAILDLVHRYDGADQTRDIAREYSDRARASLSLFGPSTAREALEYACEFVLYRDR